MLECRLVSCSQVIKEPALGCGRFDQGVGLHHRQRMAAARRRTFPSAYLDLEAEGRGSSTVEVLG
jgi:hypothetical protein